MTFGAGLLTTPLFAGNIYPVRVSDGSTTGDVDTLRFSGGTLTIGNISGGCRMGTLTISGGGGGGTNFQAGLGIDFVGSSSSMTIKIEPSVVLTAGSPVSAIAGAVAASGTNNLVDKSFLNNVSNALAQVESGSGSNIWFLNGVPFATNDNFGVSNATPTTLSITPTNVVGVPTLIFSNTTSSGPSLTLIPSNGVLFIDLGGGSNALSVDPSIVLTSGAPFSALSGALPVAALPSSVGTNFTGGGTWSNDAPNHTWIYSPSVSGVQTNTWYTNGVLAATSDTFGFTNASSLVTLTLINIGGTPTLCVQLTNAVLLAATTNNLADKSFVLSTSNTLAAAIGLFPTNGLNVTSSLGNVFSNGVLIAQGSIVPVTNTTSVSPALVTVSAAGGVLTVAPNSGLLTNFGTQALFWNGTVTVSNNATVTGTFTVNGALNASNIVGVVTSAVASVNGLVSNVTLIATGNATISTTSSSAGGTITVNDPKEFAPTNPPSAGAGAPLIFDTKYGALRVSNNFGYTFIDTPQLNGMSNVVDNMSSWFTSTKTDAWINVNVPNTWNVVNTNNHLLIQSTGEVANSRWLLLKVANTNQSWAYRILLDDVQDGAGTSTFNVSLGVGAAEGTNSNFHALTLWRSSGTMPALRGFVASTPGAVPNTVDTGGADPGGTAQAFYTGSSSFSQLPSPLWLQVGYDGSTNLYYEIAFVRNGLSPIFNTVSIKTNQTVIPGYVGLIFEDTGNFKPSYFIKAAVFEQPWSLGQP